MSIQKKVLIFAATFNEKDNIELLIQSILNNYSNADILIIVFVVFVSQFFVFPCNEEYVKTGLYEYCKVFTHFSSYKQ